jgi:ABC-type bacteriocin/lantibiotic exporter with double-glycine peptidase domain
LAPHRAAAEDPSRGLRPLTPVGKVHSGERLRLQGLRSPLAGPFDLELQPGQCVALSGASGAGKTLFLRMVEDLDPNQGEVFLDGVRRAEISAPEWRRQVPYVAADSGWWAEHVEDHFAADVLAYADDLAGRLGIGAEQRRGPVARLSTGERQRLALVRALVLDSPVLLLDEPTGALDPDSTAMVEDMLRGRARDGALVVLVSHNPEQPRRLGAIHYVMRDRRLIGPS